MEREDKDIDQHSYAGWVDGDHWATLISCFEEWAEERHYQPHAVMTARRMAETANDVPNDLVMAMFEIVEEEYDEQFRKDGVIRPENTCVWQAFDAMCGQFASGSSAVSLRGSLAILKVDASQEPNQ
jgi:hypothetical protein